MFMEERLNDILEILKRDGKVKVKDLSEKFNVSEGMIRKDLCKLEKQGDVKRTYGGAILERKIVHNENTNSRVITGLDEKNRIARLALETIEENDVIFIDISTTNYTFANMLSFIEKNITIITNMNRIALLFDLVPNIEVICIGGEYNKKLGGTVGAYADKSIRNFRVDKAFIGAGGVNVENNFISNFNLEESTTKETIINSSKSNYILASNEKFYIDGSYKFSSLDKIDYIITDKKPKENIIKALRDYNIKLVY